MYTWHKRTGAIALALAVLAPSVAFAHARLAASTPSDGAEVGLPSEIVLEFSEPVHVTAVSLKTSAGTDVQTGAIPEGPAESFTVPVTGMLAPGTFSVSWRAVSADTHIISGEFGFVVTGERAGGAASDDSASTSSSDAPASN